MGRSMERCVDRVWPRTDLTVEPREQYTQRRIHSWMDRARRLRQRPSDPVTANCPQVRPRVSMRSRHQHRYNLPQASESRLILKRCGFTCTMPSMCVRDHCNLLEVRRKKNRKSVLKCKLETVRRAD